MNLRPLPSYGMFIPSLITNPWFQIMWLELPPQRCNQFHNSIYLKLWEWKTNPFSDAMNKFYYDPKTETLYPKLNKRHKDIEQIIKKSNIDFFLRTRPQVTTWGSFFMWIRHPLQLEKVGTLNLQMWHFEVSISLSYKKILRKN